MKYTYLLLSILIATTITAQENWQSLLKDAQLSNFQKLNGTADYVMKMEY